MRIRRIGQHLSALMFILPAVSQVFCLAADQTGRLKVTVRDLNGQPTENVYINLWREIDDNSGKLGSFNCDWTDSTGRHWRPARSWTPGCGASFAEAFTNLRPGNYRATAVAHVDDRGNTSSRQIDATPYATSQPVTVIGGDGAQEVVVNFKGGAPLKIEVVDKPTGKPIERAEVRLFGPDGEPIVSATWGSGNFFERVNAEGTVRFGQLPAGDYQVEVLGFRPYHYCVGMADYLPLAEKLPMKVEAGKENFLRIALESTPLTPEEIEKRWPYEYFGKVTDLDGKPLEAVSIKVFSGIATLFAVGETKTDSAGKYRVRFASDGIGKDAEKWHVAGSLYATKPDWGETANQQPGDLWITGPKGTVSPKGLKPEQLVAPHKPKEVDFVMAPLRKISGRFVDQANQPIAGIKIALESYPQPPGYGDSQATTTDADGNFQFDAAAPVAEFKLSAIFGDEKYQTASTQLQLSNRGDHRLDLKFDRQLTAKVRESR